MKRKNLGLDEKRSEKIISIGRAAARLFNEKGFMETSMNDISDAARLSKGGIYHYFSSKNDILYSILMNYLDLIMEGLQEKLGARDDSSEKIRFFIARHIELYCTNVSEAKTLLHEAHFLPARYFKTIVEKERKYYQILASVLSEFFNGQVPKERLTTITFSLLGMCNWIYSWYDPQGPVPPEELSEIIYTIFSGGAKGYRELSRGAGNRLHSPQTRRAQGRSFKNAPAEHSVSRTSP
jgi:AcrR family transcriptional regulator